MILAGKHCGLVSCGEVVRDAGRTAVKHGAADADTEVVNLFL
jgi:hypothetical protein